ncbi:unnamed protein product [Gulo gulo]|uniref:Uncharacterized protein n=1 Tax=Gulo gulo TaxID=48420 RepID=A0A9X9LVC5_GULGU|nr:unnamed protein product [Gulo gulo]
MEPTIVAAARSPPCRAPHTSARSLWLPSVSCQRDPEL